MSSAKRVSAICRKIEEICDVSLGNTMPLDPDFRWPGRPDMLFYVKVLYRKFERSAAHKREIDEVFDCALGYLSHLSEQNYCIRTSHVQRLLICAINVAIKVLDDSSISNVYFASLMHICVPSFNYLETVFCVMMDWKFYRKGPVSVAELASVISQFDLMKIRRIRNHGSSIDTDASTSTTTTNAIRSISGVSG
jgi:hypothetical protein